MQHQISEGGEHSQAWARARTWPLAPPETMRRESLVEVMAVTPSVCASLIWYCSLPFSGPNARILPSSQPVTRHGSCQQREHQSSTETSEVSRHTTPRDTHQQTRTTALLTAVRPRRGKARTGDDGLAVLGEGDAEALEVRHLDPQQLVARARVPHADVRFLRWVNERPAQAGE